MAKYSNTSIGFDTFDRGIEYDGAIFACNCSADALDSNYSTKGLSTTITANDSWCNSITTAAKADYGMSSISSKYDHLQDEIDMLKEQLSKVGHSAATAGAALKNVFSRLNNIKVSLRNQLQTITEWQTI